NQSRGFHACSGLGERVRDSRSSEKVCSYSAIPLLHRLPGNPCTYARPNRIEEIESLKCFIGKFGGLASNSPPLAGKLVMLWRFKFGTTTHDSAPVVRISLSPVHSFLVKHST